MRAAIGLVRGHAVALGALPMDLGVKVGECGAQDFVELSRAVLVGRAPRLRGVVDKIVGEQFFEQREIAAALHFVGVAPHDRLRRLAQVVRRHDVVLSWPPSFRGARPSRANPESRRDSLASHLWIPGSRLKKARPGMTRAVVRAAGYRALIPA